MQRDILGAGGAAQREELPRLQGGILRKIAGQACISWRKMRLRVETGV